MSRVVVTGGAGFIGQHTVAELLRLGYDVTVVDLPDKVAALKEDEEVYLNPNCRFIPYDLTHGGVENFIEPSDKILHLAAVAHFVTVENAHKTVQINIGGTVNLLTAAMKKKAERIVYSSTGSVYSRMAVPPIREDAKLGPSADNYYGWSKLQAEQWIRLYHTVPHVILRYAYIYGPRKDWGAIGQWLYHDIPNGKRPVIFGGQQQNDFTYVADVVQANILALETSSINQTFNIGTGRSVSILDACDTCLKQLNIALTPAIQPARSFDFPFFCYDIGKARALLNYDPKFNLDGGVSRMVKALKLNG